MSFADLVRNGVALADQLTASLQPTIQHYPWIDTDAQGGPIYDNPISIQAIVEEHERVRLLPDNREFKQKAQITILRPILSNGAVGRNEPIDLRDKIVLPSGYTGPLYDVSGMTDPATGRSYLYVIIMG